MLGKLMKYEVKSCGRIFFPFYIMVLVFSIIAALFINFDNYEHDFSMVYIIGMLVVFALFVSAIVLTILLIVQRFSKSLLEEEGYLMFTLPVSEKTLVLSKFLTSLLFIILTSIVSIVCISLVSTMFGYKMSGIVDVGNLLKEAGNIFSRNIGGIIFYILSGIADYSVFILTVYLAITICHLPKFSKHKVLSGLAVIIVLMIIQSTIGGIADSIMTSSRVQAIENMDVLFFNVNQLFDTMLSVGTYEVVMFILNIVIAVALFFGTTTLLEKKLNLE
ncbi:hypothetical protein [Intestinibacter sp.]|uniref:hypothetical protein n=1 Tax=Intestinibacter sp. TaxID=1965304 RepID=UPI002A910AF8|nr:hypothetical protein [Intestinibacter sp.]MDY5210936.1 hypothetical protein [Intestinibacter sp.]